MFSMFNCRTRSFLHLKGNTYLQLHNLYYSSSTLDANKQSFMVSYLINSCGFAPEKALVASRYLRFTTPEKPNAVISFFKNQGLSDSEVLRVVKKYPKVLNLLPERNLLPKIEFLRSHCPSEADLVCVLVTIPSVLGRSLKKQIIPSFELLVNLVGSSENSISVVKRCPSLLLHRRFVAPSVDILLEAGVPKENIVGLANKQSFMVSYLVNSIGFAPEKAASASKHLSFSTPEKPNAVISFFKNQGLSDSEVFKVVKTYPKVLDLLPERNLLPKVEFLRSHCPTEADLVSVLVTFPNVLGRSLKKQIIPSFEFLVNLVGSSENSISIVKRCPSLLMHRRLVAPNIDILLEAGVPMENITGFLKLYPAKILQRSERYKVLVDRVREIGIHPHKFTFMLGVMVMSGLSKSSWEKKKEVFKRWGCSEEEVLTAFKIHPWCMMASIDKIEAILKFLVNEMEWETSVIMKTPLILAFSLKRRIIPRCSVLHVLLSRGRIKDTPSLLTVLMMPESKFLNNYVEHHDKEDQELLKLYNEKMNQASLVAR